MTETITSIAASTIPTSATTDFYADNSSALRFITCGSVDDGKSTLIGRLLVDTRTVLQDQLAGVTKTSGAGDTVDLAQLTDGLSAEREQGITIDVAYRYFATETRKFIIGDAPGHEQYTRNMVTAASSADAAVILVDATKLDWKNPELQLLPQTRRHSLLAHLLRVHSLVFAVNKLDAVADPALAFAHIQTALQRFTAQAGIQAAATVPVSALQGYNVVHAESGWAGYAGPSLLQLLERLPNTPADRHLALAFPVQWVEKFSSSADTSQGRRVFWGRVAAGQARPGAAVQILPSGRLAVVSQVLDHARVARDVGAGLSAGLVLDHEVDVSRGDWIVAAPEVQPGASEFDAPQSVWPRQHGIVATVAWMDEEPLVPGRIYWALHGHRWIKAKVKHVAHNLNINTLEREPASQLQANAIGRVELVLQESIPAAAFTESRQLGALILVDTASHATAGAALLE
ncbi:sulfate adenylyltransferase subunit 1 [Comamonas composti]|uniref:sulfate adenylyltransferase subunit 1 n=1 Tax=Comamonas composti TaxID=408558 RepID=UPI000415B28A|nr:GTP-binding protein [Comamonas composti]